MSSRRRSYQYPPYHSHHSLLEEEETETTTTMTSSMTTTTNEQHQHQHQQEEVATTLSSSSSLLLESSSSSSCHRRSRHRLSTPPPVYNHDHGGDHDDDDVSSSSRAEGGGLSSSSSSQRRTSRVVMYNNDVGHHCHYHDSIRNHHSLYSTARRSNSKNPPGLLLRVSLVVCILLSSRECCHSEAFGTTLASTSSTILFGRRSGHRGFIPRGGSQQPQRQEIMSGKIQQQQQQQPSQGGGSGGSSGGAKAIADFLTCMMDVPPHHFLDGGGGGGGSHDDNGMNGGGGGDDDLEVNGYFYRQELYRQELLAAPLPPKKKKNGKHKRKTHGMFITLDEHNGSNGYNDPSSSESSRAFNHPLGQRRRSNSDGSDVSSKKPITSGVEFVAETQLPTELGQFRLRAYRMPPPSQQQQQQQEVNDDNDDDNASSSIPGILGSPNPFTTMMEPCIIYAADKPPFGQDHVTVRIHDQCVTSEVFGSMRCDCKQQLEMAMSHVAQYGGCVIYLQQEGRGIGLANKVAAYSLQDVGFDTVDANLHLGFPADARTYNVIPDLLKDMKIGSIQLMTNNPRKVRILEKLGIYVDGTIPAVVSKSNRYNRDYLETKQRRMNHDNLTKLLSTTNPNSIDDDNNNNNNSGNNIRPAPKMTPPPTNGYMKPRKTSSSSRSDMNNNNNMQQQRNNNNNNNGVTVNVNDGDGGGGGGGEKSETTTTMMTINGNGGGSSTFFNGSDVSDADANFINGVRPTYNTGDKVDSTTTTTTTTINTVGEEKTPVNTVLSNEEDDEANKADDDEAADGVTANDDGYCFGKQSVIDAINAIGRGEIVVVVDDMNRENEGDFIMAAEYCTPEAMATIIRYSSGVVCIAMEEERINNLELPPMYINNEDPKGTAFTVSVDATQKHGITTGISASERSKTIQLLANPKSKPFDFHRPGHIFPLKARNGGVLARDGHTEAAVDLAKLAGCISPCGVLCEIVSEQYPTEMMRLPELKQFCKQHNMVITSIVDIAQYRRDNITGKQER